MWFNRDFNVFTTVTEVNIKCEKWTDQNDTPLEKEKNSESPTGIELTTSWTPGGCSIQTELRELMKNRKVIQILLSSYLKSSSLRQLLY